MNDLITLNKMHTNYVKDKIYTINHSKYIYEEESFDTEDLWPIVECKHCDTEVSNEQRDYILSLIEGDLG